MTDATNGPDHRALAEKYLKRAEEEFPSTDGTAWAALATVHAMLAGLEDRAEDSGPDSVPEPMATGSTVLDRNGRRWHKPNAGLWCASNPAAVRTWDELSKRYGPLRATYSAAEVVVDETSKPLAYHVSSEEYHRFKAGEDKTLQLHKDLATALGMDPLVSTTADLITWVERSVKEHKAAQEALPKGLSMLPLASAIRTMAASLESYQNKVAKANRLTAQLAETLDYPGASWLVMLHKVRSLREAAEAEMDLGNVKLPRYRMTGQEDLAPEYVAPEYVKIEGTWFRPNGYIWDKATIQDDSEYVLIANEDGE